MQQKSTDRFRCALIGSDAGLVHTVRDVLSDGARGGFELAVELQAPIDPSRATERIREARARIVLVDLGVDPLEGLGLLRHLVDALPSSTFLAAGPQLQPDGLLEVVRSGAAEYLPRPVSGQQLSEALDRIHRRLTAASSDEGEQKRAGTIIGVVGAKGGSGVTTTATNLSVLLRELTDEPTILLDLDRDFGTAGLHLGLWPRYSYIDVVQNFHRMDDRLLDSYVERHDSGVDVLASPANLEDQVAMDFESLTALLQLLRKRYAHVVVDLGSTPHRDSLEVIPNVDRLLVVTNPELPTLRNTKKLLALLHRALPSEDGQRIQVVVNRSDSDSLISAEDVREALGMDIDWTLSRDDAGVSGSLNRGVPIVMDGKSPYSRDLRRMTTRLLVPDAEPQATGMRRILSTVFGRKNAERGSER